MFHNHSHTGIDICTICMHMPKFVCGVFRMTSKILSTLVPFSLRSTFCAGIVFDAHHSLGRDDAGVSEVSGQAGMDFPSS